jgi:hypothetical protein
MLQPDNFHRLPISVKNAALPEVRTGFYSFVIYENLSIIFFAIIFDDEAEINNWFIFRCFEVKGNKI